MNHESINREISEELVNTTSQKKRGRPKKGSVAPEMNLFDDINTKKNISWSSHMEEHLLQLRLLTYKEGFINAKDKIALARTWNKILLDFNTKFLTGVSIEQLKNKFNALKSQYRSTSNSFIETGNNPLPKLPENWQTINQYFQGRDGLSGKSFGESESHTNMKAYNSAGESECETESSKRSRSQSMGSNFSTTKNSRKGNIGESIVEMGSLLSNGLIAIANNQSKESKDPTLTETMKSIKQSLDQNSLVNLEILKLLQSMKDNE